MQSLSRNEAHIEDMEELKKVRLMLITSIISYPLWGLFSKFMVPDGYDPLWQRLACSVLSLILLGITYKKKYSGGSITKFYLVSWLYSYHLLFLYSQNPESRFYVICNLIQFPFIILGFASKKDAQVYTYVKLGVVALLAGYLYLQGINPWFIMIGMLTVAAYLMAIVSKYFNVTDSLRKTKEEFNLALSNMHEGVLIMDSSGEIISFNNSAAEILELPQSKPLLTYRETSLYLDSTSEFSVPFLFGEHPFDRVLRTKKPEKGIILGLKDRWYLLNLQPLSNSDQTLISFSDITEMKKNQELKEKAQAQLAMNAKLSSLFKVAGGIAHEINNPLSVITTRLQSLAKKFERNDFDAESVKTSVEKSLSASFRISQVVGTLLQLSKNSDEDPFEVIKLSEVIEPVLKLSRESFRNNDMELVVDDIPEVFIACRPRQISQVFLNLLSNSFEATLGQDIKWTRFSFQHREQKVFISVSDSGPRIALEVQRRMMEPFFTTKEIGKGAGLGLSVSKAILEEHKGSLVLEEDTLNTSFLITLDTISEA